MVLTQPYWMIFEAGRFQIVKNKYNLYFYGTLEYILMKHI